MDEYTACEQAYKNGYEQGKKEATETLQKEVARLAYESDKRELALAKLEAGIKAVIERLSRGKWVEAKSGMMSVYPPGQVMCSVCKQRMPSQWKKMPPYCYGCGAKMEEAQSMNEIERLKSIDVNGAIAQALREQAEREKGCTHCQKPYVSIGGINEDKAIIYLGAERPYNKGNVEYLCHMDSAGRKNAFKVRHCPMCGKRLEERHEAD